MKSAAFTFALLLSATAIAQTYGTDATEPVPEADAPMTADTTADDDVTTTDDVTAVDTDPAVSPMPVQTAMVATPASGPVVQPSNANPERDARGIAVISAEAVVPAGWNGISGTAMGGPLVDPATGQTVAENDYPA